VRRRETVTRERGNKQNPPFPRLGVTAFSGNTRMFPGVFSQTNTQERTLYSTPSLLSLLAFSNEEVESARPTELGEKGGRRGWTWCFVVQGKPSRRNDKK